MKVLVTGGMGYLGSVVSGKLVNSGHSVKVFDKFIYGKNKQPVVDFEILEGDILNTQDVRAAVENIDAVVHMAGIVGSSAGELMPEEIVKVNETGTEKLVQESVKAGVGRFLFISSCSVYGFNETLCTEETEPNPLSTYAKTKLTGERVVLKNKELQTTVLRLGTAFGLSPRMRFDLIVNKMIAEALWNKRILVEGSGEYMRPLIHVQDVSKAIELSLQNKFEGILNVGSFNYTINDIAKEVSANTHGCKIVSTDGPDERSYEVSFERLNSQGFKADFDIGDAVKEIRNAKESGAISDYSKHKFSNYDFLKSRGNNK